MADLASLCAHGFSSEEAAIALERSDSVTAALVLLLQRLTPEPVVLAEADLASSGQHEALEDEAVKHSHGFRVCPRYPVCVRRASRPCV